MEGKFFTTNDINIDVECSIRLLSQPHDIKLRLLLRRCPFVRSWALHTICMPFSDTTSLDGTHCKQATVKPPSGLFPANDRTSFR